MKILITGGCGFIGTALVYRLLRQSTDTVINVDKLTYASNPHALEDLLPHPRYMFCRVDICDAEALAEIFVVHSPDLVMHLAAETHVDRSIDDPRPFIQSNCVGTSVLLHEVLRYWRTLPEQKRQRFRFHHVSTDEVFGSVPEGRYFTEDSPLNPSSPYAATKAASDHLVWSWHGTYGLPILVSYSSNNFGPRQFPEKLIPVTLARALSGQSVLLYGKGEQQRDWLYVEDHVDALLAVLHHGRPGRAYNVATGVLRRNVDVVTAVCAELDRRRPRRQGPYRDLIRLVDDRPAHDRRYALDTSRIRDELGWRPATDFSAGLAGTVAWYLDNTEWQDAMVKGQYRGERLGLGQPA